MIGYLEGKLLKRDEDRILLLVNHIGYEILVPGFVMETLYGKEKGDEVELYIYYHQTERQPKPVLIGFNLEAEKEFFLNFISVEAIGPMKAVKALTMPVQEIADAIETSDVASLKKLKGIGGRTAQKIVATLEGKMGKFALIRKDDISDKVTKVSAGSLADQVVEVLITQLGHKPQDAKEMVNDALKRNPDIDSAESLFDEVYKAAFG